MGKYTAKSTAKSDFSPTEFPLPTSSVSGVRTRAKTLALNKLNHHRQKPQSSADPVADTSSYLELRSRRLLKLKPLLPRGKPARESDPCPNLSSARAGTKLKTEEKESGIGEVGIGDFECSFGENDLDFEAGQISASRESTPCNSVRGSDSIGTPCSTTRSPPHLRMLHARVPNLVQQVMPTESEIEEFFASAEQQQQRIFLEKYNFNAVNGLPMPGRYEWVPINP